MRTPKILTAVALVASSFAAGLVPQLAANAAPITSTEVTWCGTTPVPPCIESATWSGVSIKDLGPGLEVGGLAYTIESTKYISVSITRENDGDLGPGSLNETVVVKLLTGSVVPRLVTGKARDTSVARAGSGSTREVTVTGTPVVVSGQCDQSSWPWSCPEDSGTGSEPDREWNGIFNFQVSDEGTWEDAAQRNAFYGMNYFSNVAATSVPPEIVEDPATGDPMLLIRMANRHFEADGDPVKGRGELRIPNAFLTEVYGIPDPATMTGTSLTSSLSGSGPGTVTTAQEAGGGAMLVTYDNVEFSARRLRITTGTITPTKPTQVSATRTAARKGFVDYEPSSARGAEVWGHFARCVALRGGHVVAEQSSTPQGLIRVSGLRKGKKYDCRVVALSNAGSSKWSDSARMSGQPSAVG